MNPMPLPRTLSVRVETEQYDLTLEPDALSDAASIIMQMNQDMDRGGQIGREFVPDPGPIERCQIVANRLLTALEQDNEAMATLMAAYILYTLDEVCAVDINLTGESGETVFYGAEGSPL